LNILISAIACDPYGGSEGIYGWYVVLALAKEHDCFVVTGGDSMPSIRRAQEEGLIPPNLKFRFLGQPKAYHPNRLIARLQSWVRFFIFTQRLLASAKSWHAEQGFELVQHITYTTWRIASPLWKLGIPFIWGPLSGTEIFPASCLNTLSISSRCFEIMRSFQSFLARLSPAVRACAQRAFCVPVPHQQAKLFVQNLRGTERGIPLCHNFFFPDSRMNSLRSSRSSPSQSRSLRAFAAGNLEGRKGVAIALEALFLAKKRGVRVEYHVTSHGPELSHLQRLTEKLSLSDQVILGKPFPVGDFASALGSFDIVLLPSLRDGAGLSIMEAMLAGCVPIVADWCGPAEFVTSDCGYKVEVTTPSKMAIEISHILYTLDNQRDLLRIKGGLAAERIRSAYNERQFLDSMNCYYRAALAASQSTV